MSGELSDDRLARVLDAIETIEKCLGILAEKREQTDRSAYKDESDIRDIVERRFVKMTEAVLDIGETLLVHERGRPANSNPKTMRELGEIGILSAELTEEMVAAARFRNVLAHTYGDAIDHDVVYDALADLDRYRQFVIAIRDYLDSIGELDP